MSAARRLIAGLALAVMAAAVEAANSLVTFAAVADTSLYSESDALSDGAGPHIWVGQTAGGNNRRALVRFDLSTLAPGSVVVGARLTLFQSRTISPDRDVSVHRIIAAWGEGSSSGGSGGTGGPASADDATWVYRQFGPRTRWSAPGGDHAPGVPSATTRVGVAQASYVWSGGGMVADVKRWIDDPGSNHGWILIGTETERSAMRFNSRAETFPPTLELEIAPPDADVPLPVGWLLIAGAGMLFAALGKRLRRRS